MSIIFGIANFSQEPVENETLLDLAQSTKTYAPDGTSFKAVGSVGMGFQPYHTTFRSTLDTQPFTDARGNLIVLDGRLDNHAELKHLLCLDGDHVTDSSVMLAAFAKWGETCFERFIGDWSVALWLAEDRALYLARDHAGTRTLYYSFTSDRVVWSTYLETFLGTSEKLVLDEEFAARYLGGLPIRACTPYKGVRAVSPSHFLTFNQRGVRSGAHWSWRVGERLIYKNARDYDEHFLEDFQRSIQRRDIPGASILAELSGGMDSTGIVCGSDALRRSENPEASLVDTISFYDSSEADWNELPYITATERYRGKAGIHIATSYSNRSFASMEQGAALPFPSLDSNVRQREKEYEVQVATGRYRVLLSGIGGDELLGGVPTPYPELADHLVSLHLRTLMERSTKWCLSNRDAFLPTILRTLEFTIALYRHPLFDSTVLTPWMSRPLRDFCVVLALEEEKGHQGIGYPPSTIGNGRNWLSILETMPHLYPKSTVRREYRYPYLDRDLVAYLLRVPREQLVQPGCRRAMMRRALKPLMPPEVVDRRRKAFIGRGPHALIQREQANIDRLLASSHLGTLGWVDVPQLRATLQTAASGGETAWTMALLRTVAFELWLRSYDGRLDLAETFKSCSRKTF